VTFVRRNRPLPDTRIIVAIAFAGLFYFLAFAADSVPQNCSLTLSVDGFRNRKGVIGCAVFKSPNGWPEHDDEAYTRAAIPITANTAVLAFDHVPPGRYGIACLHDENANHRLDRNFFRVPREGFGFANNPRVVFSAPSWKDASVEVTCPATRVDIHLIYK
jgi:uncharacterized protein (DUF2141 family)